MDFPSVVFNPLHEPALLFEILQCLPQKDLLLSQRVCRQWRDMIQSSQKLQERLFFRPPLVSETVEEDDEDNRLVELNPLLVERFPGLFTGEVNINKSDEENNIGPWKRTDWYRQMSGGKASADAFAPPEASWRRMLPSNPPAVDFKLQKTTSSMGGVGVKKDTIRYSNKLETGVCKTTIGDGQSKNGQGTISSVSPSSGSTCNDTYPTAWLTFGLLYDVIEDLWFRGGIVSLQILFCTPSQCPHRKELHVSDQFESPAFPFIQTNTQTQSPASRRSDEATASAEEDAVNTRTTYVFVGRSLSCMPSQLPRRKKFCLEFKSEASTAGLAVAWDTSASFSVNHSLLFHRFNDSPRRS